MHREDNVYDYIINSMNNIITNGISYYADKDKNKLNHLMHIYDYINSDIESIIDINNEVNTIEDMETETTSIELRDDFIDVIKPFVDKFMSKMTDIKIAVLNLENDLSLYYNNSSYDRKKNQEYLVETTTDINLGNKGTKDEDEGPLMDGLLSVNTVKIHDLISDDSALEVSDNSSYDNSEEIPDSESLAYDDKESNITIVESFNIDNTDDNSQSLEVEETIEDDIEVNIKPKKHSILDLFRKKNG